MDVYGCLWMFVDVCVHLFVCMCVYIYINIYTCNYIHIHVQPGPAESMDCIFSIMIHKKGVCIENLYPLVNKNSYGKLSFLMGKSTINGNVQLLC